MSAEETALSKTYDFRLVEDRYYQFWQDGQHFRAPIRPGEQAFTIVIPPPNVTGALHMGHALDNTIQDILIRYHRMRGEPTLWLPGTDHAGLATQIKVEEILRKQEGKSRHDLGREAFVERVWMWKQQYGDTIIGQLRKLGASCDWSRERFTMDEGCSRAVRTVFVKLYEKGLIYRGTYMINWCPHCETALSDIEVEHEEAAGKLYYFRYPLADGSGHLAVATTRPETMLGDTAVAINPGDERYRHLVGRQLRHPFSGRLLPVVADDYVDAAFGTGAVKITPAHDPNDFELAQRHNLPHLVVIGPTGTMTAAAGAPYAGLDRYECRKLVLQQLEAAGLLVRVVDHAMAVGHCQRCETVVEPLVSRQWFVKMKPLAEPAIRAVARGEIRIWPDRFTRVYEGWLENIRDWCISRQIWWGHRIPAWYCQDCNHVTVAMADPTACANCGSGRLEQDPDALDTWFSSALWPFSTLGWPEPNDDLRFFYPTSVLVTGYDILFFWVARMIFMGLEFTGRAPFADVLLHGLVRDAEGRKMSKSLGNGIDPLEVIRDYGADTLRFTLITGNTPGNDMRFSWERVEDSRNFANKLWNASRFVLMNLEGSTERGEVAESAAEDRWIRSRLAATVGDVTRLLDKFELGEAARLVRDFLWSEYCDWYIELVKPRLAGKAGAESRCAAQRTLVLVLEEMLRLLHPFMPFITEAIWQVLPHEGEALIAAPWPRAQAAAVDPAAEAKLATVMETIRAVRNIRAEAGVEPGKRVDVVLQAGAPETQAVLAELAHHIAALARADTVRVEPQSEAKPDQAAHAVVTGVEVYVPLSGLIDVAKERQRLDRERSTAGAELARVQGKLANQGFLAKAPADVVAKERTREQELSEKLAALDARLASLQGL